MTATEKGAEYMLNCFIKRIVSAAHAGLLCAAAATVLSSSPEVLCGTSFITGKVIDADSAAVKVSSIMIPELRRIVRVSKDGEFEVEDLSEGTYTLVVNSMSAKRTEHTVSVGNGDTLHCILKLPYRVTHALQPLASGDSVRYASAAPKVRIAPMPLKASDTGLTIHGLFSGLAPTRVRVVVGNDSGDLMFEGMLDFDTLTQRLFIPIRCFGTRIGNRLIYVSSGTTVYTLAVPLRKE